MDWLDDLRVTATDPPSMAVRIHVTPGEAVKLALAPVYATSAREDLIVLRRGMADSLHRGRRRRRRGHRNHRGRR